LLANLTNASIFAHVVASFGPFTIMPEKVGTTKSDDA
jgi:hypothetical protein